MTRLAALALLSLLAACGADGAPTRPVATEKTGPNPNIALSGEARMGVVYSQ